MILNKFLNKFFSVHAKSYSNLANNKSIADVFTQKHTGDKITIKGWIKSIRKMKETLFVDISDGSCEKRLQVVLPKSLKSDNLTPGCSVIASGNLTTAPKGYLEMSAKAIEITGKCPLADGYPFVPRRKYPPEYTRQYLHLRPRTSKFASLLRLRDAFNLEMHNYLHSEGYVNVHTPILTSNDCEGAGEVFSICPENKHILKMMTKPGIPNDEAYFNSKVFLTVSGQLHLEVAAHGLSKVYTFGPTFRAENSRTRHHLSEFYMLEAEVAFMNKIDDLIEIVERLIKNVTYLILKKCSGDIEIVMEDRKIDLSWLNRKFIILTYEEAVAILAKTTAQWKVKFNENVGFSKEHEVFIVNHCGGLPVFVINWPKDLKPFYMKQDANDETKVAAFDLLVPNIGELVGGSLRENDYSKLSSKLPKGNLDWYLDLRKFGNVPTGGFGMGFERYLQLILGIDNIKDTIPFPRWPHNCNL